MVPHFCAISRDYFGLTQDGFITCCSQFPRQNPLQNPLKFYFYGKFDEQRGEIIIDQNKRRELHQLNLLNKEHCRDCFARWSCKGDCAARLFGYPQEGTPEFLELYKRLPSPYCLTNQMLAYYYALKRLSLPLDGNFSPDYAAPIHRITKLKVPFSPDPPEVLRFDTRLEGD